MSFPTIQATVLQKNEANAFICNPCGGYGRNMPIPVGDTVVIIGDFWATPQKDAYFQGFRYTIAATAPTSDSLACFKIKHSITGDYYIALGTVAQYAAAAGACCDASPVPTLVVSNLVAMANCQNTCTSNGTTFTGSWAVPAAATLAGKYVARVEVDGALVWQQTYGAGSASIAALIVALNANASSAGTWSNPHEQTILLTTTAVKNVCFIACDKTS